MIVAWLTLALTTLPSAGEARKEPAAKAMVALVHADWATQEVRLGRLPHSPEAIAAAVARSRLLLDDLRRRGSWAICRPTPIASSNWRPGPKVPPHSASASGSNCTATSAR